MSEYLGLLVGMGLGAIAYDYLKKRREEKERRLREEEEKKPEQKIVRKQPKATLIIETEPPKDNLKIKLSSDKGEYEAETDVLGRATVTVPLGEYELLVEDYGVRRKLSVLTPKRYYIILRLR